MAKRKLASLRARRQGRRLRRNGYLPGLPSMGLAQYHHLQKQYHNSRQPRGELYPSGFDSVKFNKFDNYKSPADYISKEQRILAQRNAAAVHRAGRIRRRGRGVYPPGFDVSSFDRMPVYAQASPEQISLQQVNKQRVSGGSVKMSNRIDPTFRKTGLPTMGAIGLHYATEYSRHAH